ncbi:MAG: Spy/CpxP family protein refolding chaperone [Rubrivivax sp.]
MKPWIRRSLFGLLGATALFGALGAWAAHEHGCWRGDRTEMRAHMVDYASRRLDLDAAQKAKLDALATLMQEQRRSLVADPANPRAELQALISGASFDRVQAASLLQNKLGAVQQKSPALIDAFGDFYDSLRPEQQAKLREALARGGRRHRG